MSGSAYVPLYTDGLPNPYELRLQVLDRLTEEYPDRRTFNANEVGRAVSFVVSKWNTALRAAATEADQCPIK